MLLLLATKLCAYPIHANIFQEILSEVDKKLVRRFYNPMKAPKEGFPKTFLLLIILYIGETNVFNTDRFGSFLYKDIQTLCSRRPISPLEGNSQIKFRLYRDSALKAETVKLRAKVRSGETNGCVHPS